ncbi:MAG: tRNA (adenosine(37)-N6)-dimethylallyltransferase MiaA [Bacilli bacterium]|nr:tRNA (adenosine(37)-N6)-dimethylallyltransferase MiaA [Bacilli bacterium]
MLYVIVGPTGSGKTDISVQVASIFDLPIINADAFQIYQEMDIGTAKISKDDPNYKRHYLLDIKKPDEVYSVKEYQEDFLKIIYDLMKKHKDIIISGGTGLYIRAALYDYSFPEEDKIDLSKYESLTNEEIYHRLESIDPEALKTIHVNNRKRLIRALAISENGVTKSENIASQQHQYRFNKDEIKILFLNPPRDELYERINLRVDKMFENGLIDEVKKLLKKYNLSLTARQAIGYKEAID